MNLNIKLAILFFLLYLFNLKLLYYPLFLFDFLHISTNLLVKKSIVFFLLVDFQFLFFELLEFVNCVILYIL